MVQHNLLYAQSGGVTAVINCSAAGAIEQARNEVAIGRVFAAKNGVTGILSEELYDCTDVDLLALSRSPGGYFGSCRYKLPAPEAAEFQVTMARILSVFQAHQIRYFLYNGGGDSQDTLHKISQYADSQNYPLHCIGIPKTIDNDLAVTDTSPGFGSAAKYLAVTTLEIACDLRAMHDTSTKLFVLEVMGRNTGWLAAATSLAGDVDPLLEPDAIVLPEREYNALKLLQRCRERLQNKGFCIVVVAEGIVDQNHHTLTKPHDIDAFGHPQLGGIAPRIAGYLRHHLQVKTHWAVADYLQRSARHLASATDIAQAMAAAQYAVKLAVQGKTDLMTTIQRLNDQPYTWQVNATALTNVANTEQGLPLSFVDDSGFGINEQGKRFLRPLIAGEQPPQYHAGLPRYSYCQLTPVPKKTTP